MADLLHLVDKPEGWTSHDAVARLRSLLGARRMGHAGTLDPFASGLLLIGEGRATLALSCFALLPKRYLARARLGVTTDTQDRTGAPIGRSDRIPALSEIEAALPRFRGEIRQVPPLYSAVKVGGERLYRAARRGEAPARGSRPARVHRLELRGAALPEIEFDLTVSRGTYVRTLAHDLGAALGCGAHLVALRRISTGPFSVDRALPCAREAGLDAQAFRERGVPLATALHFLPHVRLDPAEAERLRSGVAPVLAEGRVSLPAQAWPLPPGSSGWPIALTASSEAVVLALARPWDEQTPGSPARLLRVLAAA